MPNTTRNVLKNKAMQNIKKTSKKGATLVSSETSESTGRP